MSSIDTYLTTKDIAFDEWVASYKSDEMVIEVYFGSCFFFCPLDCPVGQILDLRLPRSTRMSYKEMTDLLLDKTKDEIWKWFYCKPKCKLEKLSYFIGILNVECCVDSDEEVTLMYKSNEKEKKDVSTMSLEELIAWEQEETQSPSYLRSSHVWKKTSASTSKGKVLLDDFEDVANGKVDEDGIEVFFRRNDDLLSDKTKDDIWKWFYCKPKCKLEKGLTLVENDRDCEKMFELANFHGYLDVYVGHNPQVLLLDWYFKNLEVVCEFDEEVTSKYRSQEKARKDSSIVSLEELIAWEKEETQSPSYLRSPHVWKKTSASTRKGKVVLDDFEDVANRKGKVVLDDFADVGNGKGKVVLDESKDGLV
ncbi:hypothetical protein Tco_1151094 [Tanacetum coccineum]